MGFVNSISSNMQVLGGHVHGFNEQLESSKQIMGDIEDAAGKLGLSAPELASTTQLLAGPLAQRQKLGDNYSGGIELAKNAMIAGEATGMGTQAVSEALLRGLSPGGAIMGKLFERLVNTQAFHTAGISRPQQMSNMTLDNKTDLVIKSMSELGNNAGYLVARLDSLGVRFRILKTSVEKVLGPIGDALKVPLMKILTGLTDFFQKNGASIGGAIGKILNDLLKDPEKFLIGLMQLRKVSSDFHSATQFASLVGMFFLFRDVLEYIPISIMTGITTFLKYFSDGIIFMVGSIIKIIPWANAFGWAFNIARIAMTDFLIPFVAAFIFLQGLSKAHAMAQVYDVKEIAKLSPQLTGAIMVWKDLLQKIWYPFQTIIDNIAANTMWIFTWSLWVKIFIWSTDLLLPAIKDVGNGFMQLAADMAGFSGIIKDEWAWLKELPIKSMDALSSMSGSQALDIIDTIPDAVGSFTKHYGDFVNDIDSKGISKDVAKSVVTNNTHVDARFDMREQLEPDRIAFAVTTHLKKLVIGGIGGRGKGIHAGLSQGVAGG